MKVNLKLLEVPANSANESASLFAGNLVMITINNVHHRFNQLLNGNPDIPLLKAVVFKIFRSRMPSTV
jgi:importin-9